VPRKVRKRKLTLRELKVRSAAGKRAAELGVPALGGEARAKALTKARRAEIARAAAMARWGKKAS
jgi:hypothetical protein